MESRVDLNYVRNMFSLASKVAIVTGGAGALGQAIAQGLAVYGADVVVTGRTLKRGAGCKRHRGCWPKSPGFELRCRR